MALGDWLGSSWLWVPEIGSGFGLWDWLWIWVALDLEWVRGSSGRFGSPFGVGSGWSWLGLSAQWWVQVVGGWLGSGSQAADWL